MTGFRPRIRPPGQGRLPGLATAGTAGAVIVLAACGSQPSASLAPGGPGTAADQPAAQGGITTRIADSMDVINARIPAPAAGSSTAQVEITLADTGTGGAGQAPDELLAAARQVFGERGFSGARVAADCYWPVPVDKLFVTLWEDHQSAHAAAASTAVARARQSGMTDPARLFETGGRAYLEGSWHRRDLALLFSSGDAPPGFTAMRQLGRRAWLGRNAKLLRLADDPEDRLYGATLTSLVGRGAREVATAADFRQAQSMIDAVLGYARLLVDERPRPAHHYADLPRVRHFRSTLSS